MIKADLENIVVVHNSVHNVGFGGSSLVKMAADGLPCLKSLSNQYEETIIRKNLDDKEHNQDDEVTENEKSTIEQKPKSMNKKKVRNKILAYSMLPKSVLFMAFYSISFPAHLSDSVIRKIHNTALTRLRKKDPDFSYIWVAERQKNGTMHYHMFTNCYFDIKIINGFYAKAIDNQIKKDSLDYINYDIKKYNGVDVKKVHNVEVAAKYVSKYVTKNNTISDGSIWNCSSDISALVTKLYISQSDFNEIECDTVYVRDIDTVDEKTGFELNLSLYYYYEKPSQKIKQIINEINIYIMRKYFKGQNLVAIKRK